MSSIPSSRNVDTEAGAALTVILPGADIERQIKKMTNRILYIERLMAKYAIYYMGKVLKTMKNQ